MVEGHNSGDRVGVVIGGTVVMVCLEDIGGTVRGYDVIVSKWKNSIRPKVAAFSVVYDGVQRMDENGSSDLFLFQNALAEYQTRYRHPFTMEAC
ncbi:hypothetical protein Tco_1461333 [Tanacetum coccineum]